MIPEEKEHCCCHGEGHSHEDGHCCHNHEHGAEGEHNCCHNHEHGAEGGHHCCCHHGHDAAAEAVNLYNLINDTLAKYDTSIGDEQAYHAAAGIVEKHAAANNTADVKRFLLGAVELTSLKVTDNEESILAMVEKVNGFADAYPELPNVAAVCTYPNYASLISQSLEADEVSVTCVCGGFPSSQMLPEIKCVETSLALKDGAEEIDTVLPVGKFLSGDYESIAEDLTEMKDICGSRKLKVILETGALQSAANIKKAAIFAMYCGADFIKTSTGKISVGATPAAVYVMCTAIKDYFDKTGNRTGIKIAGGVKTVEDAVAYYTIVKETLGSEWLTHDLFRIGASSLANTLISDLTDGNANYF